MFSKKRFFVIFALILLSFFAQAQALLLTFDTTGVGLPQKMDLGKTYAKCALQTEYQTFKTNATDTDSLLMTNYILVKIQDAITDDAIDSTVVYNSEAQWTLLKKRKLPKNLHLLLPQYQTTTEQRLICPAQYILKKRRGDMNALSQNPDDCFVFAYFEIPAIYASVIHYKMLRMPQQIVGKDTLDLTNAALNTYFELKTERQIIVYKHLIVKQLAKSVLQKKTHWLYFAKGTPLKRIAREGGFTEWKEVFFCGGSLNAQQRGLIIQVQKSLKAKGYYTGKIDNTLNKKTKAALLKFQKDNALPVGTINLRTLNALGVHDVYYDL